jgi:hypothetical protein
VLCRLGLIVRTKRAKRRGAMRGNWLATSTLRLVKCGEPGLKAAPFCRYACTQEAVLAGLGSLLFEMLGDEIHRHHE